MRVIETTNLPILLHSLKEKKYFFDDSILTPIEERLTPIEEVSNDNSEKLDILINKSSLEIFPLTSNEDTTGYQFNLCSDFSSQGVDKKIIASGVLPYDTLSSVDSQEILEDVYSKIQD